MKCPQIRSEVTKEWVEYMLTEFENRNNPGSKFTLQSWEIGDATEKGDGYSGDLVKLEAKGTVQYTGDGQHEKEYNHIIKFQSPDPFMQGMKKSFGMVGNESTLYSSVIEEFNKFQADLTGNQFPIKIPTHIYSKNNGKEQILVMENMKVLDYANNSRKDLLGLEEAKLGLEQLARLHGISYAYNKKYDFIRKYPTYNNLEKWRSLLTMGQDRFIDLSIEFLKIYPEHQDLLKKIKASKPHAVKKMSDAFNKRNTEVYCLNHGDPWNNNILVKQNGDDKEDKVVFVDWEGAHWNTLAYDLNYVFAGATTPELRKHHLDDLLQHYHSHFTSVTTTLGSPVPEWGFEQFKADFDAASPWGFGQQLSFAMLLSEASKDMKVANHDVKPGHFKKCMAKMLMPLFMKPSVLNMMMTALAKQLGKPIRKELKSKSNPDLNERFLGCILEADQNGLFNIPPN